MQEQTEISPSETTQTPAEKKPYETPALTQHGSVEQLTQAKAGGSATST